MLLIMHVITVYNILTVYSSLYVVYIDNKSFIKLNFGKWDLLAFTVFLRNMYKEYFKTLSGH